MRGLVGVALRDLQVASTGDYQTDERIVRDSQADRFMREADAHSLIIAPLLDLGRRHRCHGHLREEPRRVRRGARGPRQDARRPRHGRHPDRRPGAQLAASRRELSRRIGIEQALREIAAGLTALHDQEKVLQRAVDAAASLLGADGARIDLLDERDGGLYWGYDATTGRNPGLGPSRARARQSRARASWGERS